MFPPYFLKGSQMVSRQLISNSHDIKCILFDLDGTLYNQHVLRIIMAVNLLFVDADGKGRPLTRWQSIKIIRTFRKEREKLRSCGVVTNLKCVQYENTAKIIGIGHDVVKSVVKEWIFERPLYWLKRIADKEIGKLMIRLRQQGYRLGIFSDYPIKNKIIALGLEPDIFDVLICATDKNINAFKPNCAGFERAAKLWGCEMNNIMYVGDRAETDIDGALNAGMYAVLIQRGLLTRKCKRKNVVTIRSLSDLEKLLPNSVSGKTGMPTDS